jgi:hypothetical protein
MLRGELTSARPCGMTWMCCCSFSLMRKRKRADEARWQAFGRCPRRAREIFSGFVRLRRFREQCLECAGSLCAPLLLKLRHPVGDCGDHIARRLLRCGTLCLCRLRMILLAVSFFSLDDFDLGFSSHNDLLFLINAELFTFWFSLFNEMLSSKFDFFFRPEGSAASAALILANNGPQTVDE